MKKFIICTLVFTALLHSSFAQASAGNDLKPLTREDYISTAKGQKLAGFVFLGLGAGAILLSNSADSFAGGGILTLGGIISSVCSVPLFIAAQKNKAKAALLPAAQKTTLRLPDNVGHYVVGLTLKIHLGT